MYRFPRGNVRTIYRFPQAPEVIEVKFHRQGVKGIVKYSLKTILTPEDFKAIGFEETPNKNLHLTQQGCTIDKTFDIEVKAPVKKISSKKTKTEKTNEEKKSSAKKQPLPFNKDAVNETKEPLPVE